MADCSESESTFVSLKKTFKLVFVNRVCHNQSIVSLFKQSRSRNTLFVHISIIIFQQLVLQFDHVKLCKMQVFLLTMRSAVPRCCKK